MKNPKIRVRRSDLSPARIGLFEFVEDYVRTGLPLLERGKLYTPREILGEGLLEQLNDEYTKLAIGYLEKMPFLAAARMYAICPEAESSDDVKAPLDLFRTRDFRNIPVSNGLHDLEDLLDPKGQCEHGAPNQLEGLNEPESLQEAESRKAKYH